MLSRSLLKTQDFILEFEDAAPQRIHIQGIYPVNTYRIVGSWRRVCMGIQKRRQTREILYAVQELSISMRDQRVHHGLAEEMSKDLGQIFQRNCRGGRSGTSRIICIGGLPSTSLVEEWGSEEDSVAGGALFSAGVVGEV